MTDPQVGVLMMCIDPGRFLPPEDFHAQVATLFGFVRSAPLAGGSEEILIPGEPEERTSRERRVRRWPVDEPAFGPEEILRVLEAHGVGCVLIGGFAAVIHGSPYLTNDVDIVPADDPENLRDLADYLNRRGIPFQVSLIPIYRYPANNEEIYLSDRPTFVRAIRST